jgi:hypothetical protein
MRLPVGVTQLLRSLLSSWVQVDEQKLNKKCKTAEQKKCKLVEQKNARWSSRS